MPEAYSKRETSREREKDRERDEERDGGVHVTGHVALMRQFATVLVGYINVHRWIASGAHIIQSHKHTGRRAESHTRTHGRRKGGRQMDRGEGGGMDPADAVG